ncbi:MAG: MBL fold metallo-hydrolase [Acidimicrobiales bacterium]
MGPTFDTDFEPRHGEMVEVSRRLRRIVARNPSKYTFHGTGTYVIGRGTVAVVDPGPDDPTHVDAVLHALRGETVSHVLITHTHSDHSPATRAVAAATGAVVLAHGPHPRVDPAGGPVEDPEGADLAFVPDELLAHGDVVTGPGWTVEALHTPGHISNHLCFVLGEEEAVLTGDHVMGWSSTVIPPPHGDVAAYLASLRLLLERDLSVMYPTHGGPRRDVAEHVRALHEHRLEREQLCPGPRTVAELVSVLYADVREELHEPAGRSVLAHLLKLRSEGRARVDAETDPFDPGASWHG